MKNKLFALLLSFAMVVTMMPVMALTAFAEDIPEEVSTAKNKPSKNSSNTYQYYDESNQRFETREIPSNAIRYSDLMKWGAVDEIGRRGETTTYVLDENYDNRHTSLRIRGHVHLILMDDRKLEVYTVRVENSNSIHIYAQEKGTGTLIADNSRHWYGQDEWGCAGIGAPGHGWSWDVGQNAGEIYIYGGHITAVGGPKAAGIGGSGLREQNASSGNIVIRGGVINATGGMGDTGGSGAGIGGGFYGNAKDITISGGTINASSVPYRPFARECAAAIGCGGDDHNGGCFENINISGGTITATSSGYSAAIGGGYETDRGARNIRITGGHITANADYQRVGHPEECSAAIGGGYGSREISVYISGKDTEITAIGATNMAIGNPGHTGSVEMSDNLECYAGPNLDHLRYYHINSDPSSAIRRNKVAKLESLKEQPEISYEDENGKENKLTYYNKFVSSTRIMEPKGRLDCYYVGDNVSVNDRIQVRGDIKLILADNTTLNSLNGITLAKNAKLTIYGQHEQSGQLNATGRNVVIGGIQSNGSEIKINGGHISAKWTNTGGISVGIGFRQGENNAVIINRGTIEATGDDDGVGIGGISNKNTRVIINNGNITARGINRCPGIGFFNNCNGSSITINNGNIKAFGNKAIGSTHDNISVSINNTLKVLVGSNEDEAIHSRYVPKSRIVSAVQNNKVALINYGQHDSTVQYVDEKGDYATCYNYKRINSETTELNDRDDSTNGWYVVDSDVIIPDSLRISGDVKVILTDGHTLTVSGIINLSRRSAGNDGGLKVYAQSENTGRLNARSISGFAQSRATIGLYGGNISARGSKGYPGIGFNRSLNNSIYIDRANVTATGGDGYAGIGGDNNSNMGITIKGGSVNATGGSNAPGIGFTNSGVDNIINIARGTVTARGEAGIGGRSSRQTKITISDGTVNATAVGGLPGIGFGTGSRNSIDITGGSIDATSSRDGAPGIGFTGGSRNTINIQLGNKGKLKATGSDNKAIGMKRTDLGTSLRIVSNRVLVGPSQEAAQKKSYVATNQINSAVQNNKVALINYDQISSIVSYIDENGSEKQCSNFKRIEQRMTELNDKDDNTKGWYVVDQNIRLNDSLQINGDVKVILTDGHTLTVSSYFSFGRGNNVGLTVYGQQGNTGKLIAHSISIDNSNGSWINLYGGQIQLPENRLGICFNYSSNNRIVINRAIVTTYKIGGYYTQNMNITINGGSVNATSKFDPAIGFANGSNNSLLITGGDITATGDPGIGARSSVDTKVDIIGGNINAICNTRYPGIGYYRGFGNTVSIKLNSSSKLKSIGNGNKAIGVSDGYLGDGLVIDSDKVLVGSTVEEAQKTSYLDPRDNRDAVQKNKVALVNYQSERINPVNPTPISSVVPADPTLDTPDEPEVESEVKPIVVAKTSIKGLKAYKKALEITWTAKKNADGYVIQYSTNKKFKNAKKIVVDKAKTKSKKITKLKAKKKYYLRIRCYDKNENGKKEYSKWSAVKSAKTK